MAYGVKKDDILIKSHSSSRSALGFCFEMNFCGDLSLSDWAFCRV